MAKKNKVEIKYTDEEGNEQVLVVVRPKAKDFANAQVESSKVFARLVNAKDDDGKPVAVVRKKLDDYMRDVGLWDDEKEAEFKETVRKLQESERKLARGGIKLSEAKDIALDMRRTRFEQTMLLAEKRELDAFTVEGQAENARFDYLVSCCLRDEEGNRLFNSLEEYKNHAEQDHVAEGAAALADMLYGLDDDWEKELPENKFLLEYKFVNNDMRLVDKEGNLVDSTGRRVDEQGRYLDEEGNFVDRDGNRVDEDGNPIEEFTPFIED